MKLLNHLNTPFAFCLFYGFTMSKWVVNASRQAAHSRKKKKVKHIMGQMKAKDQKNNRLVINKISLSHYLKAIWCLSAEIIKSLTTITKGCDWANGTFPICKERRGVVTNSYKICEMGTDYKEFNFWDGKLKNELKMITQKTRLHYGFDKNFTEKRELNIQAQVTVLRILPFYAVLLKIFQRKSYLRY